MTWGQARGGKWHYERKTHISGQGVRFRDVGLRGTHPGAKDG